MKIKKRLFSVVVTLAMALSIVSTGQVVYASFPFYEVKFETNGGSEVNGESPVREGAKEPKPDDPSREGYTFAGWYTDETYSEEFDFDTPITHQTTIYARWEINTIQISGVVPPKAGEIAGENKDTFVNFLIEGLKINDATWYTSDRNLFQWNKFEAGTSYLLRVDGTLDKGYTTSEKTKVTVNEKPDEYSVEAATDNHVYIYLKYTVPVIHTITFDGNDGSDATDNTVNDGDKATKPDDPSREGYTFAGWYTDETYSTEFDFDKPITEDAKAYAKWIKNSETPATYTVTVSNDGHGKATASAASGATGEEITLTATPDSGYQFKEWQVVSGNVTVTDDKFTIGNENVEVKAIFEEISQSSQDSTKPGVDVSDAEKYITGLTSDYDPAESDYQTLQAKASKTTKSSVKVSWKRVSGAKGYIIYGNKCGRNKKYKKIATVKKTSYTQKKLKKGTYYKYMVVAYDKDNKVISISKTIHTVTAGGKYVNAKSVTTNAKKNKVTIKVKNSFKLKAKAVPKNKKGKMQKHRAIQYESSNTKIATVSAKGVIKGKAKGTCYVYVYAMNGVSKKIKVTVK